MVASLFGVPAQSLERSLTFRTISSGAGGARKSTYSVPQKPDQVFIFYWKILRKFWKYLMRFLSFYFNILHAFCFCFHYIIFLFYFILLYFYFLY